MEVFGTVTDYRYGICNRIPVIILSRRTGIIHMDLDRTGTPKTTQYDGLRTETLGLNNEIELRIYRPSQY
jgi:hypothetical protein